MPLDIPPMPPPTTFSSWWTEHQTNAINTATQELGTAINITEAMAGENYTKEDLYMQIPVDTIIPNRDTYSDIYKYPALRLSKTATNAFEKIVGKPTNPYKFVDNTALIGIEIEVENLVNNSIPIQCYWTMKEDGSLRNYGREFVSIPLRTDQIQNAVSHLRTKLLQTNIPKFTNRTSTHIHLNCRDMTPDQLWNLVILYSIFEKHFYKFVGTRRLNSIFCVPIYRTNILSKLNHTIYKLEPLWYKYCGLNLLPMMHNDTTGCYGTIEFRHLFGTLEEEDIYNWINGILALRKAAMSFSKEQLIKEISSMNTSSSYIYWYNTIFSSGQRLLTEKEDFEECISNVKKEIWGNDFFKTINKYDKCKYWEMNRNLIGEM